MGVTGLGTNVVSGLGYLNLVTPPARSTAVDGSVPTTVPKPKTRRINIKNAENNFRTAIR